MTSKDPEYVSFADASELLVRKGLVKSMTPQGLRYIARAADGRDGRPLWPFGRHRGQEPYLMAGKTRLMRTARLLNYIQENPPIGRGPDRNPRRRGGSRP